MAKIHFFYSTMNAGKTTHLLQANYNYINDGFNTLLIKPKLDDRFGEEVIKSRLGFSQIAQSISKNESIKELILKEHKKKKIDFILADEVQFFSSKQIHELGYLADRHNITIMAYGLRNNFQGNLFEGSKTLFEIANNLTEIKKICHCGQKATMSLRYNEYGEVIRNGSEVLLGAEDKYVSVCRRDFFEGDIGNQARDSIIANQAKSIFIKNSYDVTDQDFNKTQLDRIKKEKNANIIARTMKWDFKTAMTFSEPDFLVVFQKIENEIERIQRSIEKDDKDNFLLKINNQNLLSHLNLTKVALLDCYNSK